MNARFSEVLLTCDALGLIGGDLFAIDGCKLPSNASKEWAGTIVPKKKKNMEELAEKIVEQHSTLDKQEQKASLNPTCYALVYDEEYHKRHLKGIQEKLPSIDTFLESAEPRNGASGTEVNRT